MEKLSMKPTGDKKMVHWKPCGKFNGWQCRRRFDKPARYVCRRCGSEVELYFYTNKAICIKCGGQMTRR